MRKLETGEDIFQKTGSQNVGGDLGRLNVLKTRMGGVGGGEASKERSG